jgi:hypothetical protein
VAAAEVAIWFKWQGFEFGLIFFALFFDLGVN